MANRWHDPDLGRTVGFGDQNDPHAPKPEEYVKHDDYLHDQGLYQQKVKKYAGDPAGFQTSMRRSRRFQEEKKHMQAEDLADALPYMNPTERTQATAASGGGGFGGGGPTGARRSSTMPGPLPQGPSEAFPQGEGFDGADGEDVPLNQQQFRSRLGKVTGYGLAATLGTVSTAATLHRPDIVSTPVPLPAELPKGITGQF